MDRLADLLVEVWPYAVTAAITLAIASALTLRQEETRSRLAATKRCLTTIRNYRRVLAAAHNRHKLGGPITEIRAAERAACPFLLSLVDEASDFPRWKRRLLCRRIVRFAGWDALAAKKLGCENDEGQNRDFWIGIYQTFAAAEHLGNADVLQLSEWSGRLIASQHFGTLLEEVDDLARVIQLPRWRLIKRRGLNPDFSMELSALVDDQMVNT